MSIVAQSYDIELDVIMSALQAGIRPSFQEVNLSRVDNAAGDKQSDFEPGDSMKKMDFLLFRTGWSPSVIPAMLEAFEVANPNTPIPESYRDEIGKLGKRRPLVSWYRPTVFPLE